MGGSGVEGVDGMSAFTIAVARNPDQDCRCCCGGTTSAAGGGCVCSSSSSRRWYSACRTAAGRNWVDNLFSIAVSLRWSLHLIVTIVSFVTGRNACSSVSRRRRTLRQRRRLDWQAQLRKQSWVSIVSYRIAGTTLVQGTLALGGQHTDLRSFVREHPSPESTISQTSSLESTA